MAIGADINSDTPWIRVYNKSILSAWFILICTQKRCTEWQLMPEASITTSRGGQVTMPKKEWRQPWPRSSFWSDMIIIHYRQKVFPRNWRLWVPRMIITRYTKSLWNVHARPVDLVGTYNLNWRKGAQSSPPLHRPIENKFWGWREIECWRFDTL